MAVSGSDDEEGATTTRDLSVYYESEDKGGDLNPLLDSLNQSENPKDHQQPGYVCYYTPSSFHTSAQLLHLKHQHFLELQTQFKSMLSLLIVQHDNNILKQHSPVVGFTSEPQHLPIVFSDVDPIALSALSAITGNFSGFDRDIFLLDRLDLAEYVGHSLVSSDVSVCTSTSQQVGSRQSEGAIVDAAISSLLNGACQVAEVAAHSIDSLFKYPGSVFIPSPSVLPNSIPVRNQSSVPVPFQRVCLLLQQHLYWLPNSQLNSLHCQDVQPGNESGLQSFTCGSHDEVQCISITHFPLESLLKWYQLTLTKHLLPHIEHTSDTWDVLGNILN